MVVKGVDTTSKGVAGEFSVANPRQRNERLERSGRGREPSKANPRHKDL